MFKYSHRAENEEEEKKREEKPMYEKFCDVLPPTREKTRERPCTTALHRAFWIVFKSIACLPHRPAIFRLLLLLFGTIIPQNFCTLRIKAIHYWFLLCSEHNWMEQIAKYYVLCGIHLLESETFHNKPMAAKWSEFIDFRLSHSLWPFDLLEMTCWQHKHHNERRRHITRRLHSKMTQFLLDISVNAEQK